MRPAATGRDAIARSRLGVRWFGRFDDGAVDQVAGEAGGDGTVPLEEGRFVTTTMSSTATTTCIIAMAIVVVFPVAVAVAVVGVSGVRDASTGTWSGLACPMIRSTRVSALICPRDRPSVLVARTVLAVAEALPDRDALGHGQGR